MFATMANARPHPQNRRPVTEARRHFIPEWAEERGKKQVDVVRLTGADKSLVSRWFAGTLPSPEYMEKVAAAFETVPDNLLKHPSEAWISDFLADRDKTEVEHIRKAMEFNRPKKGN